ncbi:hypothetical protein Esti_001551 [Eimeria stiedai]
MTADAESLKTEGADLTDSAGVSGKAERREKEEARRRSKDRKKSSSSKPHKSRKFGGSEEGRERRKSREDGSHKGKEREAGGEAQQGGSTSNRREEQSLRSRDERDSKSSRHGDRKSDKGGEHKRREKGGESKGDERSKRHRDKGSRVEKSSSIRHSGRRTHSSGDRESRLRRRGRSAERRKPSRTHQHRREESSKRQEGGSKRRRSSASDDQQEAESKRETKRCTTTSEQPSAVAAPAISSPSTGAEPSVQQKAAKMPEGHTDTATTQKTNQGTSTSFATSTANQQLADKTQGAMCRSSPQRDRGAAAFSSRDSPSPPRGGMRFKSRSNSRGRERRSPSYGAYRGRDASAERGQPTKTQEEEADGEVEDEDEVFDLSLTGGRFGELLDQQVTCSVVGGELPIPEPADALDGCKDGQKPLLNALVVENLKKMKCRWLLPIQRYAIPIVGRGHDLLGSAATGCGKTLAFLAPLVSKVIGCGGLFRPHFPGSHAQASPISVVLCPTRELAIQIDEQLDRLMAGSNLSHSLWIGGHFCFPQVHEINQRQIDVAICTPGRVDELCLRGKVTLEFVQLLVLDEADAMLDLGFQKVMTELATSRDMPENRQTLLFSATFPPNLQSILPSILRTPYFRVEVDKAARMRDETAISQEVKWVEGWNEKLVELVKDIQAFIESLDSADDETPGEGGQVIVFVSGKLTVKAVADHLRAANINSETLFGTMPQDQRKQVYLTFRSRKVRALVATSIAARGLDFPDVGLVINFELPPTIEPYVHRIGRTGRAGRSGRAISYFGQKDAHLAAPLTAHLIKCKAPIPPWLGRMTK